MGQTFHNNSKINSYILEIKSMHSSYNYINKNVTQNEHQTIHIRAQNKRWCMSRLKYYITNLLLLIWTTPFWLIIHVPERHVQT